jgi:hypothetical protein
MPNDGITGDRSDGRDTRAVVDGELTAVQTAKAEVVVQ